MQGKNYSILNVDRYSFPLKFLSEISEFVLELAERDISDWQEIQNRLKFLVKEQLPWLNELGTQILQILEFESQFVLIKGLSFHLYKRPIADYLYLALAAHLGQFTVHDNSKKVIWDVTPRHSSSNRKLTFSELNSEAPLHIDSAFRNQPEKYFGLLAINSAREGGHSVIVKAKEVVESLNSSFLGQQCLTILRQQEFPFEVPPAFIKTGKSNIILAPILADNPIIRFRLDTIEAGLKACPELATADRLWALEYFNNFLKAYPNKIQFKLDDGDIVFVNNHQVLHGRKAFTGGDRLLLRVRIDQSNLDSSQAHDLQQKIPVAI